jgi:hypothetical protein
LIPRRRPGHFFRKILSPDLIGGMRTGLPKENATRREHWSVSDWMSSLPGLTWLDPAIHLLNWLIFWMDARVKPAHDDSPVWITLA